MSTDQPAAPLSFAELDAFTTAELREKAFAKAEHARDVGFFWDLIKHLPGGGEVGSDDGSSGGIGETIAGIVDVVNDLLGNSDESLEPLLRARYIDYLKS